MAGTKEIKRRIVSVKNTKKITKAMELVAASKMKRAVNSTLASRMYAEYSWEILTSIAENIGEISHPFFDHKKTGKFLIVLITSNRGLCGAYNAQIIKKTISMLKKFPQSSTVSDGVDIITIGKKGTVAMQRTGQDVTASFTELPDNVSLADVLPIAKLITEEYISKNYEKVFVAYTDFVSALTQKPNIKQILPVSRQELREFMESVGESTTESISQKKTDYLFEGNKDVLITSLSEKLIRMQIYQMLLESNASEQSARMIAMKNASDASGEMIDDLTLVFNKARQANITREISEISAGMASVE
jgi:F-type H+-transporting ATPase subunit gamma